MLGRILLLILCLLPAATAHVPAFGEPGTSADTATRIEDPTKSWAFFGEAHGEGGSWYTFEIVAGEELYVSSALPAHETARPEVWLLGPGLPDTPPAWAPQETRAMRLPDRDDLGLEPFSPVALRTIAEWRGPAPGTGTYFVVVATPEAMHYSLAVGARESFTPIEWVTTPISRIGIQAWAGVWGGLALIGEVLGLAAGVYLGRGLWKADRRRLLGQAASGIVAGSAATVVLLATIATVAGGLSAGAVIPVLFAAAAVGVGYGAWRAVQGGRRLLAVAWAGAALIVWAGLIVGPALLLAWAAWPRRDAVPGTP